MCPTIFRSFPDHPAPAADSLCKLLQKLPCWSSMSAQLTKNTAAMQKASSPIALGYKVPSKTSVLLTLAQALLSCYWISNASHTAHVCDGGCEKTLPNILQFDLF